MRKISIFIILIANLASAEDQIRLRMSDNSYEEVIEKLAQSVDKEDVENYINCFAVKSNKQKEMVVRHFLRTDSTIEVLEKHLVQKSESSVTVGVEYKVTDSLNKIEHVYNSFVFIKKVRGDWKIYGERVFNVKSDFICDSCQYESAPICFGGECKL